MYNTIHVPLARVLGLDGPPEQLALPAVSELQYQCHSTLYSQCISVWIEHAIVTGILASMEKVSLCYYLRLAIPNNIRLHIPHTVNMEHASSQLTQV